MLAKDEEEETLLGEITTKVKASLNEMFHLILNSLTFPAWQAVLMLTIEFIQSLYFIFFPPAEFDWNFPEVEDAAIFVIKVSLIWPYMGEKSSILFLVFFYFAGFILVLCLALFIILIAVKMKKKSLIKSTLLHILGVFVTLLQTILYLPFLTMFALIGSCNGKGENVVIEGYQCWTMEHYLHVSFAAIFAIILLLIVFPSVSIYFESHCASPNAFKKITSSGDIMDIGLKTIYTISIMLFNTVWIMYAKLFLLASVCNLLSTFLAHYDFGGSLMMLILQGFFMVLYEFLLAQGPEVFLTKQINHVTDFDDYELYMKELSSLIGNKSKDIEREDELIIRGYVGEHSRLCPCPNECPLGIGLRTNKGLMEVIDKTQHVFRSMPLLVGHAERMYEYYIENFGPRSAAPRISFARFIVNFSKESTLAIKYLTQARTMKLSMQDQFFVYRYERLLEESCKNRISFEEGETINVLNVMKYEKYQREFLDQLEQNGLLHMQFWSSLLDESPSMTKVCDVGQKILYVNTSIERYWKKIQIIYPNNPRDLIAYSEYLNQVWNDNEMAELISERAKDSVNSNKYSTVFTTHLQDISNFSTDGSSCVYMSGNRGSIGKIKNCNLSFCKLFGYFKKELIGVNINTLMPNLIAEHHDKFIEKNLEKIKISSCTLSNQDVNSIALDKSRYIFPVSIKVLSTPNLLNEMQYIAKLKIDKKLNSGSTCYLILNTKGQVQSVSSSCINMIHISAQTLNNYIVDMNILAPSLFKKDTPYNCSSKNGSLLKVYHPRKDQISVDAAIFKEDLEVMKMGEEVSEFHCFLSELTYEGIGHVGFVVRLDKMQEEVSIGTLKYSSKMPNFQFRYWETANRFVRENKEDESSFTSLFSATPKSPVLSSLSRGITLSKASLRSGGRRDLSQISPQNLKILSLRSKTSTRENVEPSLKRAIKSQFILDEIHSISPVGMKIEEARKDESPPQLQRQNSFISMINENSSKIQRTKTKHSSYYEALVPKYKQLSKFAHEDVGTYYLVNMMEQLVLYGEGIKTFRLIDGECVEIFEENYSQLLMREAENSSGLDLAEGRRNVAKHKEEEYKILKTRLKTKSDLLKLVEETPYPKPVAAIKTFTLACIVLLTLLLIGEYVYTQYRLQDILTATDMLGYAFELCNCFSNLWYDAREVFLVAGSSYSVYQAMYPNSTQYITNLQSSMDSLSFNGHLILKSLSAYPYSISDSDQAFMSNPKIPLYIYSPSIAESKNNYVTKSYTPIQASQILLEAFDRISKIPRADIVSSDYLIHTVVDSLFSSMVTAIRSLVTIFFDLLKSRSIPSDTVDYLIFSLSGVDLLVCLIGGILLIRLITKYEEKVMHVFLEIPRKYSLSLNSQCETYIAELQNSENGNRADDMTDDDEEKGGEYIQTVTLKNERGGYERIYTHKKNIGGKYLVSFVILMLITESYFIIQFVMRSNFYDSLSQFSTIYRISYQEMTAYLVSLNIYREYFTNPGTNYGRIVQLNQIVSTYWNNLYQTEKDYRSELPTKSSLLGESSKNYIETLFSGNLCTQGSYSTNIKTPYNCSTFANQTTSLGLNSVKSYLIDSLKIVMYNSMNANNININDQLLWDIKQIHDALISPINQDIISMLKSNLISSHDSQLSNRIIYLVVFTICLNVIFAFLCYPFLTAMQTFVRGSRNMLSIIPVDCLILCKGFEKLILKFIKNR